VPKRHRAERAHRTRPANCHPSCTNRFSTDAHAGHRERKADQLHAWAELAPEPEAIRLRRTAADHLAAAEQHWATRIGADGTKLTPPATTRPEHTQDHTESADA
jgi:hypothetical protein